MCQKRLLCVVSGCCLLSWRWKAKRWKAKTVFVCLQTPDPLMLYSAASMCRSKNTSEQIQLQITTKEIRCATNALLCGIRLSCELAMEGKNRGLCCLQQTPDPLMLYPATSMCRSKNTSEQIQVQFTIEEIRRATTRTFFVEDPPVLQSVWWNSVWQTLVGSEIWSLEKT